MSRIEPSQRLLNTYALDHAPKARRFLYIWTFISGLLALQILHFVLADVQLNIWLSLALLAGFIYSYNLAPRWRPVTTYGVSIVALGLSVFFFLEFQRDLSTVVNSLGILLGLLMALLAFKAFAPGDHRFIIMVCVVFLTYSAAITFDYKFMLLLPLLLFSAGCALYAASQVEVATRVSQTTGSDIGDSVEESRIEVGRPFILMLLRAVGGLIAMSVLAYVVTPHNEAQQRNLVLNTAPHVKADEQVGAEGSPERQKQIEQRQKQEADVGLGDNFDLSQGSKLSAEPRPVLQMKCHRAVYLRAQVYDVYTGSGWVKSPWMNDVEGNVQRARGDRESNKKVATLKRVPSPSGNDEESSAFMVPLLDFPSVKLAAELAKRKVEVSPENPSVNQGQKLGYDELHQEIKLLEDQPPFYFSAYAPYRIENISQSQNGDLLDYPLVDAAGTMRPASLERWHKKGFSFTVRALELHYQPKDLQQVQSAGPSAIVRHYTELPLENNPQPDKLKDEGIDPKQYRVIDTRLTNFAKTVANGTQGAVPPSIYDKVRNIYQYLNDPTEFTYTRDYVEIASDKEFTSQFLFAEKKQGHCRYFASTMAVLCRLNGIPARVVSGYSPGDYSLADNAYVYKASNAHAWVEVYFDGFGWVLFDPTPDAMDSVFEPKNPALRGFRSVVDFLQDLFVLDPSATQKLIIGALANIWLFIRIHWPGSVALAFAVGLGFLAYRLWLRHKDTPLTEELTAENPVIAAYLKVLQELRRIGLPQERAMTARQAFAMASQVDESVSAPLSQLLPIYELAAFGASEPDAAQVSSAEDAAAKVAEAVQTRLDELKRQRNGGRH